MMIADRVLSLDPGPASTCGFERGVGISAAPTENNLSVPTCR